MDEQRGTIIRPCEICDRPAQWHHKFSKTKNNLQKYGVFLIHHPWNRIFLCQHHHNNLLSEMKWNEQEFIENFELDNCRFCSQYSACSGDEICRMEKFEFDKNTFYSLLCIDENTVMEPYGKYKIIDYEKMRGLHGRKTWFIF